MDSLNLSDSSHSHLHHLTTHTHTHHHTLLPPPYHPHTQADARELPGVDLRKCVRKSCKHSSHPLTNKLHTLHHTHITKSSCPSTLIRLLPLPTSLLPSSYSTPITYSASPDPTICTHTSSAIIQTPPSPTNQPLTLNNYSATHLHVVANLTVFKEVNGKLDSFLFPRS